MVAEIGEKIEIVKTLDPLEDLQRKVRKEMQECLVDAAKKLNCHPEQLKIRVVRDNLTGGCGYEVERLIDV